MRNKHVAVGIRSDFPYSHSPFSTASSSSSCSQSVCTPVNRTKNLLTNEHRINICEFQQIPRLAWECRQNNSIHCEWIYAESSFPVHSRTSNRMCIAFVFSANADCRFQSVADSKKEKKINAKKICWKYLLVTCKLILNEYRQHEFEHWAWTWDCKAFAFIFSLFFALSFYAPCCCHAYTHWIGFCVSCEFQV